ncbi:MAG: hypothetical protein KDK36_07040, partial [Leptospiraceae bacterium]|nr:hypothetical protein [Leptospiraceae bacterium]
INDELQLKIKDIEFSEKKLEESIKENSPYLSKIAQGFGLNVNQLLNSSNPIRWSKNLGKMNWIDADKACQKLGNNWRLPKKGEWLFNYFTNIKKMKEWEKESDILIHWTISNNSSYSAINNSFQTNNGKKAYGFNISNGDYSFEKIDLKFSTRCIRD